MTGDNLHIVLFKNQRWLLLNTGYPGLPVTFPEKRGVLVPAKGLYLPLFPNEMDPV